MRKPIIGICGHAGSGKDTAANYISKEFGYKMIASAEPIKDFAKAVFGFSHDQLYGDSKQRAVSSSVHWEVIENNLIKYSPQWLEFFQATHKQASLLAWLHGLAKSNPNTINARVVLQTLGTEWGRDQLGDNIWIKHTMDRAGFYMHDSEVHGVIVTDVRFANEIEVIKSSGGKIIKLNRHNTGTFVGIAGHRSEIEQDSLPDYYFDYIVDNNHSLDQLYADLEAYIHIIDRRFHS